MFAVVVVQITIGNAGYQCPCVSYVSLSHDDNTAALIVGLSVGLALLLIVIIIIANVVLRRRHRSKQTRQRGLRHRDNMEMSNNYTTHYDDDDYVDDSLGAPGFNNMSMELVR